MKSPDKQTRRRRWWLAVLGASIVVLLYWWWSRPAELRLVSRVPVKLSATRGHYIVDMHPSPDGPLFDNNGALEAYRWDGSVRWKLFPAVKVVVPSSIKQRRLFFSGFFSEYFSISANDRYQAAILTYDRNHEYVAAWEKGHLLVCVPLPASRQRPSVQALNSGRVLCFVPSVPVAKVFCVDKSGIIARGSIPAPTGTSTWAGTFASDGRALVVATDNAFTYYHVTISTTKIRLTKAYTATEPPIQTAWGGEIPNRPLILSGNILVSDTGAIYNASGKQSGSTGWRLIRYNPDYPTTAIVQAKYEDTDVRPIFLIDTRICFPGTGKVWRIPKRQLHLFCYGSVDGRYALVDERPSILQHKWLVDRMEQVPALESFVRGQRRKTFLSLYRRPGHLVAQLPTRVDLGADYVDPKTGLKYELTGFYIDGKSHSVHAIGITYLGNNRYQYSILRFTW